MDRDEDQRLLALLDSVEKECNQEERDAERDRQILRRQIFPDNEANEEVDDDEFFIEREGSNQSDDDVHNSIHDADSERYFRESEEGSEIRQKMKFWNHEIHRNRTIF